MMQCCVQFKETVGYEKIRIRNYTGYATSGLRCCDGQCPLVFL